MKRYDLAKVMYDLLPPIYKDRDDEAVPTPYPLRRFYQLAGAALDDLQVIISKLYNLYDIPRQSEEIIDELARSFGFEFPENFTLDEKRLFLYNFPKILSMKGTDEIYEAIAHIFFYRDAIVSTEWEYKDSYLYGRRTVTVDLDVPDTLPDFEEKRKKFDDIVEYFRTINVSIAWNISVFYEYDVKLKIDDSYNFDWIDMNDNFVGKMPILLGDLLNYGTLPIRLYGSLFIPEEMNLTIIENRYDSLLEEIHEIYGIGRDNYLNHSKLNKNLIMNKIFEDFEKGIAIDDKYFEGREYKTDEEDSNLKVAVDNFDTLTDYRNTLNFGRLNRTIELNLLPKEIEL